MTPARWSGVSHPDWCKDPDTCRATAAGALAEARRSGERVEVGAFRSEDREVYAQPDGSFTAIQHLRPVRTRKNGTWTPIDTTLQRRSDGSVAPVASSVDLVLSGGGDDDPLVRMARVGRAVSLSWPGRLPEPTLDGDSATYAEVLPGVDLVVRADVDGFSHLLLVKTRQAAQSDRLATLRFALGTSRVEVRPGDDVGGLRVFDTGAGGAVFEALPPKMWDSSGAGSQGVGPSAVGSVDPARGPPQGSKVAAVGAAVDGGELVLEPEQALLTEDDTEFPVYIDPVWKTVRASAWTMVSSGYPRTSYYKFDGKSTEGVGFCDVGVDWRCVRNQKKRLFYRMPTRFVGGKTVLRAEFVAVETHAYNCNDPRVVELWHTKAFDSASNWNRTDDNWLTKRGSRDVAYCSRTQVEFNVTGLMRKAANRGWNTTTFGLRAWSESSMGWWKRFADDAFLRVKYNTPPKQPKTSDLSMSPGGDCGNRDHIDVINQAPTLFAQVYDPDREDRNKVHAQFQLSRYDGTRWVDLWTSKLIGPKTSGSIFQAQIPASSIPQHKRVEWHARAYDGTQFSPWSSIGAPQGCFFIYDPTVPAPPDVSSTDYPESNPEDPNDPWYDGVGRYGQFTIDSVADDVTEYWYGVNADPTAAHKASPAQPGGPVTVEVMPTREGPNFLRVQAFDEAGNASAVDQYIFRVRAGTPARARWRLDEASGTATVTGEASGFRAGVRGGATLGAEGVAGTALSLDGESGHAATAGPVVRTDRSFAVAAWVRLRSGDSHENAIVQVGRMQSGFQLGYDKFAAAWAFKMPSEDAAGGGGPWNLAIADSPAQLDTWTHLLGVYDATAGQLLLYVDGRRAAVADGVTAWDAAGGLQIGRSFFEGTFDNRYWPGDIDEVKVFDRALSDAKAQGVYGGQGPAPRAYWSLDEAAGSIHVTGQTDDFTAELHGGAALGADGIVGTALSLDTDTNDYAATGGPIVRTDQGFAVSAWVRLATLPSGTAVIASQDGSVWAGFNLYYAVTTDRWGMAMYRNDADGQRTYRADSAEPPIVGEWTHLVGVYDATQDAIQLFVNGQLQETTSYESSWSADGAFNIGRGLWNGSFANRYFPGDIDDVRVFDRVVTGDEVRDLFTQHPVVVGRWKLNEASGSPPTTPDDSVLSRPATLAGDASIGVGWVGSGGLVLDGAGDSAATGGPIVDTRESFTVAGWAQPAGAPTRKAAVFSQAGDVNSGFVVRYAPGVDGGAGGWQVEMPDDDTTGAAYHRADHSNFQGSSRWHHLAIVYDAFQDQMRLYVNGQLEQTETDVSWRWNTIGFAANSGLQLGRSKTGGAWGEHWPGVLDDVWAFKGIATEQQIQRLADGIELPTDGGP